MCKQRVRRWAQGLQTLMAALRKEDLAFAALADSGGTLLSEEELGKRLPEAPGARAVGHLVEIRFLVFLRNLAQAPAASQQGVPHAPW